MLHSCILVKLYYAVPREAQALWGAGYGLRVVVWGPRVII